MSLVNFLYKGPNPDNKYYNPQGEIKSGEGSFRYNGEIEKRAGPKQDEVTYRIDQTVNAVFKKKHLAQGQRYWTWMHRKCTVLHGISIVGGIAGVFKALAYAGSLPPPFWVTAWIVRLVAIHVFSNIIELTSKRQGQAGEQLKKWKVPISDIVNHRWHLQGNKFSYAYENRLKEKNVVSQSELQDLWRKEIESYRERFNEDNPPLDLVEEFFEKDQFGVNGCNYAGFTGRSSEPSHLFVTEYERLKREYATETVPFLRELIACRGNNKKMQELKTPRDAVLKDYCSKIKDLLKDVFNPDSAPSAPSPSPWVSGH